TPTESAPAAPEIDAPEAVAPRAPSPEIIEDNVFVVPRASAADVAVHSAEATKATSKVPGVMDRAKDYVVDGGARATDRVAAWLASPALVGQAEGGTERAAAGSMLATRLPARGVPPAGGAGSRATQRGAERASRASIRLQKSSEYKLLLEYED